VSVKNGENFTVILIDNPSTWYAWNASVTSGLIIVNERYLPSSTGLLGPPGLHQWRVMANGTGDQKFNGTYVRPMEPRAGNETVYVLNVKIV
jgi:inhibitor of cysteine peptidase